MQKHLLTSALFAGVAAGLLAALLQFAFVIPVIQEAELYETGARVHFTDGAAQSVRGAPELGADYRRDALTAAFDVVTYTAYGLILAGLMWLSVSKGAKLTPKLGLIWGLAGFVTVQLAPAFGLPPELPGAIAADLVQRQIWWTATVLATGAGVGLIAFGKKLLPFAGVVLIALPHVIGAPQSDGYFGVAPPELAAHFVTLSLGTTAIGWGVLGLLVAYFLTRKTEA